MAGRWLRVASAGGCLIVVVLVANLGAHATAQPAPATEQLQRAIDEGRLGAGVLRRLLQDGSSEAIVVFDDSEVQRSSAIRKAARHLELDDAVELRAKAIDLANLKVAARAAAGSGIVTLRDYRSFAEQHVRIDSPLALLSLLRTPEVALVTDVGVMEPALDQSLALIRQPEAALAGNTGAGTSVAVLDTGVNYQHEAFGPCSAPGVPAVAGGICRVAVATDIAAEDGSLDDLGHGTNVSGIVAGVAPGARIIALDVFVKKTTGWQATDPDILAALDWVIANQAVYNIVVVNMSFATPYTYHKLPNECSGTIYATLFTDLRSAGILPVVASGNDFWDLNGNRREGISNPACTPGAISVGAVYDAAGTASFCPNGTETAAPDKITCFSQTGAMLSILAPGCWITAAGMADYCGTSMAAPHVAGTVAVLAAARPLLTPFQRECALTKSGPLLNDIRKVNGVALNVARRRLDVAASIANLGISCGTPNPATPVLTSLSPGHVPSGTSAFSLILSGASFAPGSSVLFGGVAHAVTFADESRLTITVLASEVLSDGDRLVQVCNPPPAGGCSALLTFTVDPPATTPAPSIANLSPTTVTEGSAGFEMVITGSGFDADSRVDLDGFARTTTVSSATEVRAAILASDIATAGDHTIAVCSPAPAGCSQSMVLAVTPAEAPAQVLYLSIATNGTVGTLPGLNAKKADILRYDGTSYSRYLKGADIGLGAHDGTPANALDGFQVLDDGSILLSLANSATLPQVGAVDDSDIIRFVPTSVGDRTVGAFLPFFDASAIALTKAGEDVDAFYWDQATGSLYLSMRGQWSANVGLSSASGGGQDVAVCTGFVPNNGQAPCAKVAIYFDGDDVGLEGSNVAENIDALYLSDGTIYFSTSGSATLSPLGGLTGQANDVFACHNPVPGSNTTCGSAEIAFQGSSNFVSANVTGYNAGP